MGNERFSITVIRPRDLLLLRVQFIDVDLDDSVSPAEVTGGGDARMIVHFQPQHIAEQAFWSPGKIVPVPPIPIDTPAAPGAVQSFLARATRLAFRIPATETFALRLEDLLDAMTRLPLEVSAVAAYEQMLRIDAIGRAFGTGAVSRVVTAILTAVRPPPVLASAITSILRLDIPPHLAEPGASQTAIEAPYRLFLSPDSRAKWDHANKPVDHGGSLVELWHTRLGSHREDGDPRVRAVWAAGDDVREAPQAHSNDPFRMALDARDRNQIVHFTSDYHLAPRFRPSPVETHRLMLTTLGAWLDLEQEWTPPEPWNLEQWRHIATMGRDHYVRVVEAGYLLPFRHRASLVKITERKFHFVQETQGFVAYDFQRMFILVRERTKTYTDRDMPLRSVEIRTRVTPDLNDPADSDVGTTLQDAFWPQVTGPAGVVDFPFQLVGRDWEGRPVEFHAPLLYVSQTVDSAVEAPPPAVDATTSADMVLEYNAPANAARRQCDLAGQAVAFAPSKISGDTTQAAASITWAARDATTDVPRFEPFMAQSSVAIPAVRELIGSSVFSTIEFEPSYVEGALASGNAIGNSANVYARVTNKPALAFPTDKTGGLVAPDVNISALSRSLGPLGGNVDALVKPALGQLDPADAMKDVKLLGGMLLSSIIRPLTFDNAATAEKKLPRFRTLHAGNVIETEYVWSLGRDELVSPKVPTDLFRPDADAAFTITARSRREAASTAPPQFSTTGKLTNFAVVLAAGTEFELVSIHFNEVTFTVVPGKKLDTSVDLRDLQFLGFLKFVNELREVIPLDGFNDPPSLDVSADGVRLGFSIGIPSIGVGVMTMQNISLSAGFYLPFIDEPMNFRFAFCERHQPFILTVSGLGGGGFIAMNIGLDGMESLEASLEFGASVALNLGVASGSVTIMAGIYFQAKAGEGFELTAYIRACGEMDVLGIISVCIEIYIGLKYISKGAGEHGGKLFGQASVSVKIKIAFFSMSVSVSMERELAGSDPNFTEMLAPSDWAAYCDAFDDYAGVGGA